MFVRFSSESKVYNLRLIGEDVVVSWDMPINLSDFNAISLTSFHIGTLKAHPKQSILSHLSSNIVQSSVSNPNGNIFSFVGSPRIINKGNVI